MPPGSSESDGRRPVRTKVIGLTGNIGSGKTTVAGLLAERGAAVIDSDALAREATADRGVLAQIADTLGPELIREGTLHRERTSRLVFADEGARRRLEEIIHPWVRQRGREIQEDLLARANPPPLIVQDIPLLFESGLERNFAGVLVVTAPFEVRAARVAARNGLSHEEFEARDRAQWPLERKAALADWVVDNSGDPASLEAQVAELWPLLTSNAAD